MEHDLEKHQGVANHYEDPTGAVPDESFEYGDSLYAKLQRFAGRFNIEQRGIERVPENERTDTSYVNIGSMWLAANMVVPSFTIGVLGNQIFYLGFVDAVLVILFFNLLGVMTVCFYSCFGPVFGLRQMVLSRFYFGWWGVKIIAFFNVLTCIGWSAANVIVGAQLINAVNPNVPGPAGIVIIAACTFIVTLFGYRVVHLYEYWSWIPSFIVYLIVLGVFAHSGDFVNIPWNVRTLEMGNVLCFGATVFGFATGWTSVAADYTVYQPANRSRRLVFLSTWLGLIVPLLFTQMLGTAVATATSINNGDNIYQDNYNSSGIGGLLGAVLFPPLGRFGQFCMVILSLSIVANNCPNNYSVALTMLVLGRWTRALPRFVWTFIATCVYIAIAIPGYFHFEAVLVNFMDFIAYWLAIYEGIAITDHFLFKRGFSGYHVEAYVQPEKLPPGIAPVAAFCFGIAGMVTGMSQQWWVGPIALHAGELPYGGDVGFELGFAFSAVSYFILRKLELKYFGR